MLVYPPKRPTPDERALAALPEPERQRKTKALLALKPDVLTRHDDHHARMSALTLTWRPWGSDDPVRNRAMDDARQACNRGFKELYSLMHAHLNGLAACYPSLYYPEAQ